MKNKIITVSIILLTLLSACKSEDNPVSSSPPSKLNGTWSENTVQSDDTLNVSVTLNEKSGKVSGSYSYLLKTVEINGSAQFVVTEKRIDSNLAGTFSGDKVSLSFGLFEFAGILSSDASKITGIAKHIADTDTVAYSIVLKKEK